MVERLVLLTAITPSQFFLTNYCLYNAMTMDFETNYILECVIQNIYYLLKIVYFKFYVLINLY